MRHADVYDDPGSGRVLYGNLPGYWLTHLGIRQARAAGKHLRDLIKLDYVVCSPLERTRQTAEIVIVENDNDPQVVLEPELRDIGVDPWQGKLLRTEWTEQRDEFWQQQLDCKVIGLEPGLEMQARAFKAFMHHAEVNPDANILFVSHGDIICFLLQHFLNEPLEPLVHYRRGVNKASVFSINPGPPLEIAKIFEPIEYGTVYPRPRLADPEEEKCL